MALPAVASLEDRDGVTILVTGDEEIGSPSSRALIEAEAAGAAAVFVLGGLGRRRRAEDRAQGHVALPGASCTAVPRTPASSRRRASARPSNSPTRCSRPRALADPPSAPRSPRRPPSRGHDHEHRRRGSLVRRRRARTSVGRTGPRRCRDPRPGRRCSRGAASRSSGGINRAPLELSASAGLFARACRRRRPPRTTSPCAPPGRRGIRRQLHGRPRYPHPRRPRRRRRRSARRRRARPGRRSSVAPACWPA